MCVYYSGCNQQYKEDDECIDFIMNEDVIDGQVYDMEILKKLKDIGEILSSSKEELGLLPDKLSEVDQAICDILHFAETDDRPKSATANKM